MQYTEMAAVTIQIALTCSPRLRAKVVKEAKPTKTTMPQIKNDLSDFIDLSLKRDAQRLVLATNCLNALQKDQSL